MRLLHRHTAPSITAVESHEQAERDLAVQEYKHEEEAPLRNNLKLALEENHLAWLVYNALQGQIEGQIEGQ